jgi:hypothetical protein
VADLQKLSPTHDQILNWLVINPGKSLRECADAFGYTQSWLSQLVHSDLFQARLKEMQLQVQARVTASIPQKLNAVVDVALDKLADKVAQSEDPEFLLEVMDKGLHRMGFGPATARQPAGTGGPLVQQNFLIQANDLHEARALMRQATPALEGSLVQPGGALIPEVLPAEPSE